MLHKNQVEASKLHADINFFASIINDLKFREKYNKYCRFSVTVYRSIYSHISHSLPEKRFSASGSQRKNGTELFASYPIKMEIRLIVRSPVTLSIKTRSTDVRVSIASARRPFERGGRKERGVERQFRVNENRFDVSPKGSAKHKERGMGKGSSKNNTGLRARVAGLHRVFPVKIEARATVKPGPTPSPR